MITKQDIIEEIRTSRLSAKDIHEFSERLIPITQCYDFLRKMSFSIPTALLLRGYAARVRSTFADDAKSDTDNAATVVESVTGPNEKRVKAPARKLLPGVTVASKVSKKVPVAEKTSKRFIGDGNRRLFGDFWVLQDNSECYKIPSSLGTKDVFLLNEVRMVLDEFKIV